MTSKDQTPSNTPDPQWDDLVARLQGDAAPPKESASAEPGAPAQQGSPAEPGGGAQQAVPEEAGNGPEEKPQPPHEKSAAERQAELRRLFNTGPGAPGPRDFPTEEPDGDFIPEEPPAIGSGDPVLTLSWCAAAGGPLALLLCVIFFRNAPSILYFTLALISLAGVAMLLRRLPKHRDPGDDGARV